MGYYVIYFKFKWSKEKCYFSRVGDWPSIILCDNPKNAKWYRTIEDAEKEAFNVRNWYNIQNGLPDNPIEEFELRHFDN